MKTKKKTKTLTINDNPVFVVCPGHVDVKTFNQAFKNEGWSEEGEYAQENLRYEYWVKTKTGMKRSLPGKNGAKAVTIASWD